MKTPPTKIVPKETKTRLCCLPTHSGLIQTVIFPMMFYENFRSSYIFLVTLYDIKHIVPVLNDDNHSL